MICMRMGLFMLVFLRLFLVMVSAFLCTAGADMFFIELKTTFVNTRVRHLTVVSDFDVWGTSFAFKWLTKLLMSQNFKTIVARSFVCLHTLRPHDLSSLWFPLFPVVPADICPGSILLLRRHFDPLAKY